MSVTNDYDVIIKKNMTLIQTDDYGAASVYFSLLCNGNIFVASYGDWVPCFRKNIDHSYFSYEVTDVTNFWRPTWGSKLCNVFDISGSVYDLVGKILFSLTPHKTLYYINN